MKWFFQEDDNDVDFVACDDGDSADNDDDDYWKEKYY